MCSPVSGLNDSTTLPLPVPVFDATVALSMRWIVPLTAVLLLAAAPALGAGSGIRGRVTSSPTCPVERMPPDPQCAPRGFVARVRVRRQSDHHVVTRITTRSDGRFQIALRPGRYLVSARS